MNAQQRNRYTEAWRIFGESVPRPRAILVISAHWYTNATRHHTAMPEARTIHDFYGFPQELFDGSTTPPGRRSWTKQLARRLRGDAGRRGGARRRIRDFGRAVPTPDHFLPLHYIADLDHTQPFDLLVEGHAAGSISMAAYTVGLDCDTSGVSPAGPAAPLAEDFPTMEATSDTALPRPSRSLTRLRATVRSP